MKNPLIELYRFVACLCIAVFHYEWMYVGSPVYFRHFYLWVELFFLIAGFFVAKSAGEHSETGAPPVDALQYTYRYVKKLYPQYLVAFGFSFAVAWVVEGWQLADVPEALFRGKWEILLMQISGFENTLTAYNGVTVYLSAQVIATLALYYVLTNHRRLFVNLLGPFAILAIYAHILQTYGNLSVWKEFETWLNAGVLRGFAGMSVGALAYLVLVDQLKRLPRGWRIAVNACCSLACAGLVLARDSLSLSDLLIFLPIFAVLVASAYGLWQNVAKNGWWRKVCIGMGRLSYPVFLMHYGVILLMRDRVAGLGYWQGMVSFLGTILLAGWALMGVTRGLSLGLQKLSARR